MKAIVFGGSGFLGSHVADALTEAGHHVSIYDLNRSLYLRPGQTMIVGDILDEEAVRQAVEGCDVVYNFAGVADIDEAAIKPLDTVRYNILGNCIIMEAARLSGVKRYIFASTVYVYSQSGSFYRCSKVACENYIEQYQKQFCLDYTILRYGTLYGPRTDMKNSIRRFITQAITEGKITYPGDGNESREYIHVVDAAQGSVEILDETFKNQHIIFTGQQSMKVSDLLSMIKEILNNNIEIEYLRHSPEQCPNHYKITPYNYTPRMGKKYVKHYYMDLGQGLLQGIEEVHHGIQAQSLVTGP
jgi:UDP-glucose 4-epimerase